MTQNKKCAHDIAECYSAEHIEFYEKADKCRCGFYVCPAPWHKAEARVKQAIEDLRYWIEWMKISWEYPSGKDYDEVAKDRKGESQGITRIGVRKNLNREAIPFWPHCNECKLGDIGCHHTQ